MKKMFVAVIIPCLVLVSMTLHNQYLIMTAPEFEFEVEGYDPRDILAGHYLQFRIKYKAEINCTIYGPASMCVSPEQRVINSDRPTECQNWIAGRCEGSKFKDDLNRFYIPQDRVQALQANLIDGKASVKVVVGKGNAVIKDLLINGRPWTETGEVQGTE